MTESSFPITDQDIVGAQWSQALSGQGKGILDDWGSPYSMTLNDTDQTMTIHVLSVSNTAKAVVAGYGHKIDADVKLSLPTVTTSKAYYVGLLYDPANEEATQGPVQLVVLTAKNFTGGQVYLPLYTVTRSPSTALSASKVVNYRTVLCPVIYLPTYADMIDSDVTQFAWGTIAVVGDTGSMFQAQGTLAEPDWYSMPAAAVGHKNRSTVGSTADFTNGTMAYMTGTTITNAQSGWYMCYGAIKVTASADQNAAMRMTAVSGSGASGNPVPDSYFRATSVLSDAFMQGPYEHTSGDLTVNVYCQMSTGKGTVYGNGTYAGAFYIGG